MKQNDKRVLKEIADILDKEQRHKSYDDGAESYVMLPSNLSDSISEKLKSISVNQEIENIKEKVGSKKCVGAIDVFCKPDYEITDYFRSQDIEARYVSRDSNFILLSVLFCDSDGTIDTYGRRIDLSGEDNIMSYSRFAVVSRFDNVIKKLKSFFDKNIVLKIEEVPLKDER